MLSYLTENFLQLPPYLIDLLHMQFFGPQEFIFGPNTLKFGQNTSNLYANTWLSAGNETPKKIFSDHPSVHQAKIIPLRFRRFFSSFFPMHAIITC